MQLLNTQIISPGINLVSSGNLKAWKSRADRLKKARDNSEALQVQDVPSDPALHVSANYIRGHADSDQCLIVALSCPSLPTISFVTPNSCHVSHQTSHNSPSRLINSKI